MMNCLRLLLLATLLACCTVSAFADLVWPTPNGAPIYQSQLGFEEPKVAVSDAGVSLVVWGDESTGTRDIRGQLIDANQQPLWPDNGLALVELYDFQDAVQVIHAEDGWIMLWLDRRFYQDELDWSPEYNLDLFIQKYNNDGEPLWHDEEQPPANGVHVVSGDFPSVEYEIQLLPDGNGGAYVVYILSDQWEATAIPIAQHVLSDGSFAWTDYGVDMLGPDAEPLDYAEDLCAFVADDGDGLFAAWVDRPIMEDMSIQVQRVYGDGTLWDYPTAPVVGEPVDYSLSDLNMCTDGWGGAFLLWGSYNDGVFAQRVAADGTLPWGDTSGQMVDPNAYLVIWSALIPSDDHSAICLWSENQVEHLNAQRFGGETSLETYWGNGVTIGDDYDYTLYALGDGFGGAVIITGDYHEDQVLTQVDVNGDIVAETTYLEPDGYVNTIAMAQSDAGRVVLSHYHSDGHARIRFHSFDVVNHLLETPVNGLTLNDGESGSATEASLALIDATPYWAWSDYRINPFGRMLVMQSLDPLTGEQTLGQWGIPLLPGYPFVGDDTLTTYLGEVFIDAAGDDNLIVSATISTYGVDEYDGVVLQKVTPDGDLLWGDQGVLFDPALYYLNANEALYGLPDGGCIVIFTYYNADWCQNIGAQRFNANGEPMWSQGNADFIPLSLGAGSDDDDFVTVEMLDDGSMMILSIRGWSQGDYYVKRLSGDGELLWDEDLPIAIDDYSRPSTMVFDGNLLVCMTYSSNDDPRGAIHGQLINPDGDLLWGDVPQELIDLPIDWSTTDDLALQPCGENLFWLAYTARDDFSGVFAQQFDLSGVPQLFPLTGAELSNPGFHADLQRNGAMVLPDNSLYVAWFQHVDYDRFLVYRRITQQGTFPVQYIDGPVPIIETRGWTNDLTLGSDGEGGAYTWWQEYADEVLPESAASLWAQRLNDGFMGVDEPSATTPDQWTLHQAYPNPFNATTTIKVDLPQRTHLKAQVFDILGREVITLADKPFSPGRHTLTVDASRLASGMYFLRVNQPGGMTRMQKLVLLK